jgi:hypothetical protein
MNGIALFLLLGIFSVSSSRYLIKSVVGTGKNELFGDNGKANNASLNYPCGISLDSMGNIYIGDRNNRRVRKVDINGYIYLPSPVLEIHGEKAI